MAVACAPASAQAQGASQSAELPMVVETSTAAGIVRGTTCSVLFTEVAAAAYNCRIVVTCGERTLYGEGGGGFNSCVSGSDRSVTVNDTSWADGDPMLSFVLVPGQPATLRIATESAALTLVQAQNSPQAPAASPRPNRTVTVVATAWASVVEDDLGRVYDANFRPVPNAARAFGASSRRATNSPSFNSAFTEVLSAVEVRANASGWASIGLASAALDYQREKQLRVYRAARQVRTVSASPDVVLDSQGLDPGARYVLTEIIYGYSVETIFRGTREQLEVEAGLRTAAASVSGGVSTTRAGVQFFTNLLGYEPSSPNPEFVVSEADVERQFRQGDHERPIQVVFTEIPGRGPPFVDLELRSIRVDCSRSYDSMPGYGRPEIRAYFGISGRPTTSVPGDLRQDSCEVVFPGGIGLFNGIRAEPDAPMSVTIVDVDGGGAEELIARFGVIRLLPEMGYVVERNGEMGRVYLEFNVRDAQ